MLAPLKGLAKKFGFGSEEQKSLAYPDTLTFELFGVTPSISGANVSAHSALRVPAVLHAVRLIAENCGSTPVKVYREANDSKEAAKDHPAYRLVHRMSNEWTSAVEFCDHFAVVSTVYPRDPDPKYGHGVLSVEALIRWTV